MKLYMYMCVRFHVFQCQRNKNTIKVNIHHTKILVLIYIENRFQLLTIPPATLLILKTFHSLSKHNAYLWCVMKKSSNSLNTLIRLILCTKPAADSYFNSIDFELSSLSMTKTSECL